jgi:hypothetical protein
MSDLQKKDVRKCYYETDVWPSDRAIFSKCMAEEPTKVQNLKQHRAVCMCT